MDFFAALCYNALAVGFPPEAGPLISNDMRMRAWKNTL